MANAPAAMAVRPVARPSSPSVRLTALELPVTTSVTKTTYNGHGSTSRMYLSSGSWVDAAGRAAVSGRSTRNRPKATPKETWPTSFQRATSPCDLPRTIFR